MRPAAAAAEGYNPDLGPGRVWRWAVSKGWRGAAAYAYLGHCRVG